MIIKFSPDQLQKVKIEHLSQKDLSEQYVKDRDEFWKKKQADAAEAGKEMWNGNLYTLEGSVQYKSDQVVLTLGECKYSDVMFKKTLGFRNLEEKYGKDHLQLHCSVACIPITSDGKIVVGRKKMTTGLETGVHAYISGVLNKDELEVNSFEDLALYSKKEAEEEATIEIVLNRLEFMFIGVYSAHYQFTFSYQLDIHSKDVGLLLKEDDDEFEEFFAFSDEELKNFDGKMLSGLEHFQDFI